MPDRSPELNVAVRAVRGESDLVAVMRALEERNLARVTACAPETHRLMQSIDALRVRFTALLNPAARATAPLDSAASQERTRSAHASVRPPTRPSLAGPRSASASAASDGGGRGTGGDGHAPAHPQAPPHVAMGAQRVRRPTRCSEHIL